jgi:hypothetical protein
MSQLKAERGVPAERKAGQLEISERIVIKKGMRAPTFCIFSVAFFVTGDAIQN